MKQAPVTHSLVVDNGHLFNATKAAELIFKVTFLSPDAQPKYTKDVGRIRLLIVLVSRVKFPYYIFSSRGTDQTVRSPTRRRPP
jgi:hypothetical protein